jgi:hypothetical protein
LRPELLDIVKQLLEVSLASREISLDALGDAIGTRSVSYPEIDAMMTMLEAEGRLIVAPAGQQGEALLRRVLDSLRVLGPQLGRRPKPSEIAEHAGMSTEEVRQALLLAQVMQR